MVSDNSNGPRNYYEDQFGERIRNIVKGGQTPPPPPSSGSSGPATGSGSGFGRGAGFLIVFLVLGVLRAVLSSSHRHTPPPLPPPRIQFPEFQAPAMDPELAGRLEELHRRIRENKEKALGLPPVEANLPRAPGINPPGVDKPLVMPPVEKAAPKHAGGKRE